MSPRRLSVAMALLMAACSASAATSTSTVHRVRWGHDPLPVLARALAPDHTGPILPPTGAWTATIRGPAVAVFDRPHGDRTHLLSSVNGWDQRLRFLVLGARRDPAGTPWLRVRLPVRPNGSAGWVRGDLADLHRARERIVVDLSQALLTRYRGGDTVQRFTVGVGKPSTPTPAGRYFVWARVAYQDVDGPYGAYALGLSGFSDVITDWVGGGRIAIHGTADAADPGHEVSFGCVRVYNPQMLRLRDVPMGTPVVIRP